ncbi:hypothetical protein T439DRAFT_36495 [Meredithblackwellia eburnea MCA 4105]
MYILQRCPSVRHLNLGRCYLPNDVSFETLISTLSKIARQLLTYQGDIFNTVFSVSPNARPSIYQLYESMSMAETIRIAVRNLDDDNSDTADHSILDALARLGRHLRQLQLEFKAKMNVELLAAFVVKACLRTLVIKTTKADHCLPLADEEKLGRVGDTVDTRVRFLVTME